MKFNYNEDLRELIVKLEKDLDHHEAQKIRNVVDNYIEIYMPLKLIFDFEGVGFMDSSGIGVIMGRYKNMQRFEGQTVMRNIGMQLKKVLDISGITSLIPIEQNV